MMVSVDLNNDGEKVMRRDPLFEEAAYAKFCEDVYNRIDILSEHADCVSEGLKVMPVYQKEFFVPLHDTGNGLKLEVALLRGNLGLKDLSRPNIPPCLWNAGFDSISSLEVQRNEDFVLVGKMEKILLDCEEVSEFLISLQAASEDVHKPKIKGKNSEENHGDEGIEFAGEIFGSSNSNKGPFATGNKRPNDGEGELAKRVGFERKGSGDCDKDAECCLLCMVRMTSIERQLTGALLCLSGLEDAKSGAIESALMVKDFIFRN